MTQDQLPGMPPDPLEGTQLGNDVKAFAEKRDLVSQTKLEMDELEKNILAQMKLQNIPLIRMTIGGENFEFEIKVGEDSLSCRKITKQPKKSDTEGDIGGEGAKKREVATV